MNHIAKSDREEEYQSDWQHAYVAGFKDSVLDETKYAKMVTDYLGIGSTFININNSLDETKLLRQAYYLEDLWMNSQIPQMQIYANERASGTVVSIDGHGADELLAGYGFNMKFAFLDAASDEELLEVSDTIMHSIQWDSKIDDTASWRKKRILKAKIRNAYEYIYRKTILRSDYTQHKQFGKLDNLSKSLCVETHDRILPTLLRNYDRASMSSGVEIRMPFMDYRIVSFAQSLPWNSKIRNGYSKAIIRDALSDIMPHDIVYRRDKIGFNAPAGEWLRKDGELYLNIVNESSFLNSSVVRNPRKVKTELEKFIYSDATEYLADMDRAQRLLQVINLFIWEQAMIKGKINQ
jgi:asparagine synthase (glutamine-hydrolysing)